MVLRRQLQYVLLISYQPPMVLRLQLKWFHTAKSNTPDQEQATINKTNDCKAPQSWINNPVHTTLMIKELKSR